MQGLALGAAATAFRGCTRGSGAEVSSNDASAKVKAVLEQIVRDTRRDRAAGRRVSGRQAGGGRVGRHGRRGHEEARRRRHAVHAVVDHQGRHRHRDARVRREAQTRLQHADREGVARVGRQRQGGRDASHGPVPPDRRAAVPGRLHPGLAARLGSDVQGHRRPEADVSDRPAHGVPLDELRLHQRRDPAPRRRPHDRQVPAGRDCHAARHQRPLSRRARPANSAAWPC